MTTLALIGKGRWGKKYINTISNLSSCELPDKFIKTTNYRDLFASDNIDGVIIATPASTHFQIAKEFLEKGFNLLIEKPMTTSLSDALKLKKSQGRSTVMVGHIFRYNPYFIELQKQIKKIGKIKSIHSEGMNNGPFRDDVSALWDYAPHDISMIVSLLGNPLSASASETGSNSGDSYTLKLKFSGDLSISSKVSRVSSVKKRNLFIIGEKGEIIFDDVSNKKLLVKIFAENRKYYPQVSKITPLENELLEFIDCIKTKRRPKTDLDEAIVTIKVLEAAEESIKQDGKEINLD